VDWDKLRVFHAVAEAGSFTHAGDRLGISQSSVSRQIMSLEEGLGTPLFHRHPRGLKLTEQGEALFNVARDVFAKLTMAENMVAEARERPKGPLRITTTVAFGSIWLTERLREFIDTYPEISVSLIVTEEELDVSMGKADVAIRMSAPRQPDLIQRHLLTMHHRAYASRDYVERHGTPEKLADLDQHRLIAYDESFHQPFTPINWLMSEGIKGRRREAVLRVNNIYGMFRACASGLGIASLPDYMAQLTRGLVPVLPELARYTNDALSRVIDVTELPCNYLQIMDFLVRQIERHKA